MSHLHTIRVSLYELICAQICCPAGSLIIWDSRLIHWNQTPTGEITRIVAYICYQPRSAGTKEELETKVKIFERRQGTTHASTWSLLLVKC